MNVCILYCSACSCKQPIIIFSSHCDLIESAEKYLASDHTIYRTYMQASYSYRITLLLV